MKIFKINEYIEIVCEAKKTRNGFKHEATLIANGQELDKAKCNYLNRTWERYEFQSVMLDLINKTSQLNKNDKDMCRIFLEKDNTDWTGMNTTLQIAKLGDIFGTNDKEKNDWKLRMLKAGIQGLDVPDDWNELDENTKSERIGKVISFMQEQIK